MNSDWTLPEIRNKLSPISNLIEMVDGLRYHLPLKERNLVIAEIQKCKLNILALSNPKHGLVEKSSYGGQLKDVPDWVVDRILECQEEQGNIRDARVFEFDKGRDREQKGFSWDDSKEGFDAWDEALCKGDYSGINQPKK